MEGSYLSHLGKERVSTSIYKEKREMAGWGNPFAEKSYTVVACLIRNIRGMNLIHPFWVTFLMSVTK